MTNIGAKVYTLAMNSAVYTPTFDSDVEVVEWIHAKIGERNEFVKLEDYDKALKLIIELQDQLNCPDCIRR